MPYIDGGHTYEGVLDDITNFTGKLKQGGYLVMDDASYFIPGTVLWKRQKFVSEACKAIDENKLINVLNIRQYRIYKKL